MCFKETSLLEKPWKNRNLPLIFCGYDKKMTHFFAHLPKM